MIFKNKYNNKPMPNFKIEIDNKYIEQVDTTKFLGILIDNNRWWWYWEVPSMQIRIITFIPLLSTLLDVR